jgi:hypothetical protein
MESGALFSTISEFSEWLANEAEGSTRISTAAKGSQILFRGKII